MSADKLLEEPEPLPVQPAPVKRGESMVIPLCPACGKPLLGPVGACCGCQGNELRK